MEKIIDFFAKINRKNSIINLSIFVAIPIILILDCILYVNGMATDINGNISVNELIILTACVSIVSVTCAVMTYLGISRQNEMKNTRKIKRKGERL